MAFFSNHISFYAIMICCALLIIISVIIYKYIKKTIKKIGLPFSNINSVHLVTIVLSYKVLMICIILSVFILIHSIINKIHDIIKQTKILPNLQHEIDNFANSDERDLKQIGQDMQKIMHEINDLKSKIKQGKQELCETRQELNVSNLNSPATTGDERGSRSDGYRSPYANVSDTRQILDDAQAALEREGRKADKIAQDLFQKEDTIDTAIIISDVIIAIKELTRIESGSYQQVKYLKTKFNKQLSSLSVIACKNENLMKEFTNINNNISQSFKTIRSGRTQLSDFQKEIASHIQLLNSSLKELCR